MRFVVSNLCAGQRRTMRLKLTLRFLTAVFAKGVNKG